jgi:hypothetical protein
VRERQLSSLFEENLTALRIRRLDVAKYGEKNMRRFDL